MIRIRQIALVAADLDAAISELSPALDTDVIFQDPGVAEFGLHNALFCKSEALRLTNMRAAQAAKAGNPGPEGSISKLMLADFNKKVTEFSIELMGADGMVGYDFSFRRPDSLSVDGSEGGVRHAFLRVRANSIEGGTSEIMRNILGEQVLGLPGEPRVDKDIAWSKVPRS